MKILWVSWSNEYAWGGDIIAYRNKNNDMIMSKKQYDKMIERELQEILSNMDIQKLADYEDFDDFWASNLNSVETDFEPLVEFIVGEDEDMEKYNPYIEMHWLEILALEHEKSIFQIAKKGGLSSSTLYSIIDRNTQLCDISVEVLNKILKGLGITIFGFIYNYDGRLF